MTDILISHGACAGIEAETSDHKKIYIHADQTILQAVVSEVVISILQTFRI